MAVKSYALGDRIIFTPKNGSKREGSIRAEKATSLLVHLDGDPFAVDIPKDQCLPCKIVRNMISSKTSTRPRRRSTKVMPTATEPRVNAKQLRLDAQGLGIEGYESMTRQELSAAIAAHGTNGNTAVEKPARRSRKTAPAPAETKPRRRAAKAAAEPSEDAPVPRKASRTAKAPTKATAKPVKRSAKAAPADTDPNVNPFRKGSNLHIIVPLLLKGGKRLTLAQKLQAKVQLHHYSAGDDATSGPSDFDKRITLCAGTLRDKHGWTLVQEGRGMSGWLQCVPPGGELPNRPNARTSTRS